MTLSQSSRPVVNLGSTADVLELADGGFLELTDGSHLELAGDTSLVVTRSSNLVATSSRPSSNIGVGSTTDVLELANGGFLELTDGLPLELGSNIGE